MTTDTFQLSSPQSSPFSPECDPSNYTYHQVIENLGCPEWKEECEEVRMRSQETCQKGMKNLLLQLFLILHSKGHNIFSKISEKFWSYSATEQLCLIFSLLEVHFWIYPTIKTIWDEFQDSYYMNSDIKFFERTECQLQSDNQDPPYGDCFPWMSSATSTSPIKGSHILRIESKNGQYFIDEETDEKKTETETANNMIKIRCCCNLEKAGLCFMILFSHLDTRRYRHDHNTTNENSDDRYHYFTLRNNDGKTDIVQDHHDHNTTNENSDDIYHYFTLRNNDGQTNIVQDKEMTSTEEMQILFETNMRSNIYFSPQPVEFVPEAYSYTHSSYNTGHNLCNTVCVNKNLLN